MMNRREFLTSVSAASISTILPIPAISAQIPAEVVKPTGRWFAVGFERLYHYFAKDETDAILQHAISFGYLNKDDCPECGGYKCLEHLTEEQWDQPNIASTEFLDVWSPERWNELSIDQEPENADWCEAGFLTFCDNCNFNDEPVECIVIDRKTYCEECEWKHKYKDDE